MLLGHEQIYNPEYSLGEKFYIAFFGMPIVGLRIRGRNIFSLIPNNVKFKNILDAGSGPGVLSFELSRRFPDAHVLGIDMLPDAVAVCNTIAKKIKNENVKFICNSIENIQEKNQFDLIVCVDILEHIEDDTTAILSLYNALTNKGTLILHVPALYRRYPVFKKSKNFDVKTHVRYGYELEEISKKLQTVGFAIKDKGFTYGFLETLANNISYMITGAQKRKKYIYAIAFPILNFIAILGAKARPKELGAGVYIIATKLE